MTTPGLRHVRLLVLVLAMACTACVPGDGRATAERPAGFLWGVWHGWVAPVALGWGFFDPRVRVYEPLNTGWWYDCGYYTAVISGFGGLSLIRRSRRKRRRDDDD